LLTRGVSWKRAHVASGADHGPARPENSRHPSRRQATWLDRMDNAQDFDYGVRLSELKRAPDVRASFHKAGRSLVLPACMT